MAAVDKRRNRVSKFVSGHNSRIAHPMEGKHHTEQVRAYLASFVGKDASTYKHGWSRTATYSSWSSMHSRCKNPANASYKYYGAKGISVHPRWDDFLNFLSDMGARPSKGYQIDRIDPEGDYEPGNCRWLTVAENLKRRRSRYR